MKDIDWSALDEPVWTDRDVDKWIRDLKAQRKTEQQDPKRQDPKQKGAKS
jgi:hypothetical protein